MSFGAPDAHANDLLKLIQLRAAAEKRAEEAEASLKLEQHSVWKLKQEVKMLESRMSEAGTRKLESTACLSPVSNSPSLGPRNSCAVPCQGARANAHEL
jgi:hypothetical protein